MHNQWLKTWDQSSTPCSTMLGYAGVLTPTVCSGNNAVVKPRCWEDYLLTTSSCLGREPMEHLAPAGLQICERLFVVFCSAY
jgi:hypothetical protein